MIFLKSWNWPSYSRECSLYLLCWHLVIETSSWSVNSPKFASLYYWLWMWWYGGTQHRRCRSAPTDYGNSHVSGYTIKNTLITGHFSPLKMSGPLLSMSCISNNLSFRQKQPGVPEGSGGSDRMSYPLTEIYTLRVAYVLLHCVLTFRHHPKDTCVTLFAGVAVMVEYFTHRLPMLNHSY